MNQGVWLFRLRVRGPMGYHTSRAHRQARYIIIIIPAVKATISISMNAKSAWIWLQYIKCPQVLLLNNWGMAPFRTAALTIQNVQVRRIHINWEPTDDTGCFDHLGCMKRMVKMAAVTLVQQAVNRISRIAFRASMFG